MNTQRSCWYALFAVAALLAPMLATVAPAAAMPDGVHNSLDSPGTTTTTGEETTSDDQDDDGDQTTGDDLLADDLLAPIGPVAHTGAAIYDTLWPPGELLPADITVVRAYDNTELVTFVMESSMMAVVIIEDADAPTEYRFENAVPVGHTAAVHPDGSVRFFDVNDNEVAGILAPWAIDADAKTVPTHYTLDGTTLVQTVNHQGAAYPVVADPVFVPVSVAICIGTPSCAYIATSVYLLAPTVIGAAWRNKGGLISGDRKAPGKRPTNKCNSRNRSGC